ETAKRFTNIGVHYLQHSSVTLGGIKIYGAPHTPTFGMGWAFNRNRGSEIAKEWALIPEDAEVVMTHGPPMFFGDKVPRGHVGCFDLLNKLDTLSHLKVHISGHLHEGYGMRHR
ncbi:hypothetical protein LRR18_17270, partial [Mangrovimonas sp. AS39]|nr:hypothetical protein [Mangrovimonas futianensis]